MADVVSGTYALPAVGGKRTTASGMTGTVGGRAITHVWGHAGGEMFVRDRPRYTLAQDFTKIATRKSATWDGSALTITVAKGAVGGAGLVLESLVGVNAVRVAVSALNRAGGGTIQNTVTATGNQVFDTVGRPIRVFVSDFVQITNAPSATVGAFHLETISDRRVYGYHDQSVIAPWFRTPTNPTRDPADSALKPLGWVTGSDGANGLVGPNTPGTIQVDFEDRPIAYQWVPDPLVPIEVWKPARAGAAVGDIDIPQAGCAEIWIDVFAAKTLTAGTYTGTITLSIGGNTERTITLNVVVKNWTAPDRPSRIFSGLIEYTDSHRYVGRRYLGEPYMAPGTDQWTSVATQEATMNAVYNNTSKLLHEHRMCAFDSIPWHGDESKPFGGTAAAKDYEIQRGDARNLIDGAAVLGVPTRFSAANGYEGPGINTGWACYSIGTYGGWRNLQDNTGTTAGSWDGFRAIHRATRDANCCVAVVGADDAGTVGGTYTIADMPAGWTGLNGARTLTPVSASITGGTAATPLQVTLSGLSGPLPDYAEVDITGATGGWSSLNGRRYLKRVSGSNYTVHTSPGGGDFAGAGFGAFPGGTFTVTSTKTFFTGVDTSGYASTYESTTKAGMFWAGAAMNFGAIGYVLTQLENWFGSNAPHVKRFVYLGDEIMNYRYNAPRANFLAKQLKAVRSNANIKMFATTSLIHAYYGDTVNYDQFGFNTRELEIVAGEVQHGTQNADAFAAWTGLGKTVWDYNSRLPQGSLNIGMRGVEPMTWILSMEKQGIEHCFMYLMNRYWDYENFPAGYGTVRKWRTNRSITNLQSVGSVTRVTTNAREHVWQVGEVCKFNLQASSRVNGWEGLHGNDKAYTVVQRLSDTQFDVSFNSSACGAYVGNSGNECGWVFDSSYVDPTEPGNHRNVWKDAFTYGHQLDAPSGYESDLKAFLATHFLPLMGPTAGTRSTSHSNGYERLYYPGRDLLFPRINDPSLDGPIASRRMKQIRRAQFLVDLFRAAKIANATAANAALAARLPHSYTDWPGINGTECGPATWSDDDDQYTQLLNELFTIVGA
jgi:hypothetical protein